MVNTCGKMVVVCHKRGDTLDWDMQAVDVSGNPIDITGMSISCKVKAGDFEDNLDATITDAEAGIFNLYRSASLTELWPISVKAIGAKLPERMFSDVEFTLSGDVTSTETFEILVVEDITNAG